MDGGVSAGCSLWTGPHRPPWAASKLPLTMVKMRTAGIAVLALVGWRVPLSKPVEVSRVLLYTPGKHFINIPTSKTYHANVSDDL